MTAESPGFIHGEYVKRNTGGWCIEKIERNIMNYMFTYVFWLEENIANY